MVSRAIQRELALDSSQPLIKPEENQLTVLLKKKPTLFVSYSQSLWPNRSIVSEN
jgi:hypothetical protein